MAKFILGKDIFSHHGDLYLVTVNTRGVMGCGVAEAFARRHPDLVERYKHDCRMKIITIGNPVIYQGTDGKNYMMFPSKDNWRNPSQYDYIARGLDWMINNIGEHMDGFIDPSWKIIMPPLGCGNGKLNFAVVADMIDTASKEIPNEVIVVHPPWMQRFDE